MKEKRKARYGSGSLKQVGRIWHVKWREVRRGPDGAAEYVQHRVSTRSEDKEYAERFLRGRLQAVGGRRPREIRPDDLKYEDLREAFVAEAVANKARSLRRGTITGLGRLDRFFGGWGVADFKVRDLKAFRQECRRGGLKDATANRLMAALRRMFTLAVENEWLDRSDVPSYFPMAKEPSRAQGAVFIEDEWYRPLCGELREPLRSAFILCYHTGIRVGEAEKLRWGMVNLARREVSLSAEITKTGEPRDNFLPSDFKLKPGKADDLVFPNLNTREPWQAACLRLGIGKRHCRACGAICDGRVCPTHGERRAKGLGYSGVLFRCTRHTAARNYARAGMREAQIMQRMGHVTRSMLDRYSIGKEGDVEQARLAVEKAHRERQARLRK